MTCVDFQRKLSAYADGELSRWTRWKVQQHLGHCADCSGLLMEFEEIDGALLGTFAPAGVPAPHYLTDAVMRRLPAMPPAWRRPATVVRWATAGALAGAQLLAVYGAYWWGFSRANALPGPGARGGMTTTAGPVGSRLPNSPTRTPVVAERSDRSNVPTTVWGRRDPTFPLALPESVVRPETRRRGFPMPESRNQFAAEWSALTMSAAHFPLTLSAPCTPLSLSRPDAEAVLGRSRSAIYAFIRRKGFCAEEADDLTQETLIRAYTHLEGFRGTSMDAWLYRIAANVAVDFIRKRRLSTIPLDYLLQVDSGEEGPGSGLDRAERRAQIQAIIDDLPACHQRILRLRYFEDCSLAEIAGAMNCTPMAAKLRVFRAVTALRKRWRNVPPDAA